jgi:hypothetical protein
MWSKCARFLLCRYFFSNTFMVFSVFGRQHVRGKANALRTVVAVVVFTFVVFGIGVESAFAQQSGKVQKRTAQKRTLEGLPRTMSDPPYFTLPPAEVIGDRPGTGGGGGPIPIPPPVPSPDPTPAPPPGSGGGGGSAGGGSGSGSGPEPTPVPPIIVTERIQTVFCSCDKSVYSTPHPGHLENCPRSPTNHFSTRIIYTSSVTLLTSDPDKSHSEVCSNGDVSGAQVIKRKRITDYPQCGDDNSTYDYLPYGGERCSN